MCHGISWREYFYIISLIILFYYSILCALYLKSKIPFLQKPDTKRKTHPVRKKDSGFSAENASRVIKEIEPIFSGGVSQKELLFELKSRLKKYHQRDEPGFREIINAFIVSESENKCSILLNEDDLNKVWF
ncbi:MAG: hypothetical protein KGM98_00915 [Bacteroidota bacterium]|nr:hypothetical protein [Bacteroidota bacterium]